MDGIEFKGFRGLRNDVDPERLESGDLVVAENVDLDNSGRLSRRSGYVLQMAGDVHSLWADSEVCLFVQGSTLKRLNDDLSTATSVKSLSSNDPVSYDRLNDTVYYSNGTDTGAFGPAGVRSWGLTPPDVLPAISLTGGNSPAGTYQYTMTYLRTDGQESGAGPTGTVELTEKGGIIFGYLPVSDDPDVTHKAIYLTPANGEVLYRAMELDNSTTTAVYTGEGLGLVTPLDTRYLMPPPAGHVIAHHYGRMLVATDRYLYHSEAMAPELFDYRRFTPLPHRITLVAPTIGGVFVGTDNNIAWLAGPDADSFTYEEKADYGAIQGTLSYVPSNLLALDIPPQNIPVWTGEKGIVAGLPDGSLISLTEARYRMDNTSKQGAAYFDRATNRYVTIIS